MKFWIQTDKCKQNKNLSKSITTNSMQNISIVLFNRHCILDMMVHWNDLFLFWTWSMARIWDLAQRSRNNQAWTELKSGFLFRFIIGFSVNLTYDSWQQVNTNSIHLFRFLLLYLYFMFCFLNTFSSIYIIYLFSSLKSIT